MNRIDFERRSPEIVPSGRRTNVPEPKVKKESDATALEPIVELKVGHFELRNGLLQFADRRLPLIAIIQWLTSTYTKGITPEDPGRRCQIGTISENLQVFPCFD